VVLFLRDRRFSDPRVERTRIGSHELLVVRGLLSRQELRAAYRASDLAVFPYRFVRTGLPLVALEAVATGLPVVTTRVHPIRELEGRTGLVFAEPRDPSDLATRIREVFENDALNGIRRRNEEWIRTSPDWKAAARTFVSLAER
jgi:glycosyltransferase involved in cell wall biosynthesis